MFFSTSRPNDAALVVKHSGTQSDNNELSAIAARNYCCKKKVLDCVSELKADTWPGVETQPSYTLSARASVIQSFSAVRPKLT